MTYTPIVIGSLNWGAPVNNAFTSQDARITDLENQGGSFLGSLGFVATPYDPAYTSASAAPTSGTIAMMRVDLTAPATLSTVTVSLTNAGVTLTAGQNFIGLYTAAGTLVAQTADQSVPWVTSGEKNAAFTVPYAAAAGVYHLAILSNAATVPLFIKTNPSATSTAAVNHGLTAATGRWASGPAAQTTLPASITMASRTLNAVTFWYGLS